MVRSGMLDSQVLLSAKNVRTAVQDIIECKRKLNCLVGEMGKLAAVTAFVLPLGMDTTFLACVSRDLILVALKRLSENWKRCSLPQFYLL